MIEADRQEPDAQPCPSVFQVSFARAFFGSANELYKRDVIAFNAKPFSLTFDFVWNTKSSGKPIFCSCVDFIENMKLADLHLRLYPIIFK